MPESYIPRGVIPANLLPMHADLSIDEASYRKHLRDLADVRGVTAITTNAHASEVASLDYEEQRRIIAVALDEVGDRLPIVAGVYADGSLQAARRQPRAIPSLPTRPRPPPPARVAAHGLRAITHPLGQAQPRLRLAS